VKAPRGGTLNPYASNGYLRDFLPYINPKYTMKWFHREIADAVQAVFEGLEKIINKQ
jgi:hypothetical protein